MTTSSVIVPRENTGQRHHARRNRGEATGTRRTRQVADIPSIISIHAASIIVIALTWHTDARSLERQGIPREFTTRSRVVIISNDWNTQT